MNMNEWAREIHENAVNHGWWESDRELPEILMLIVSELSEALEEYRAGRPMVWYKCMPKDVFNGCINMGNYGEGLVCKKPLCVCADRGKKPEGIAVEVIDALIRILDWCGKEGIDVEALVKEKHEYNKIRPYKHGKRC